MSSLRLAAAAAALALLTISSSAVAAETDGGHGVIRATGAVGPLEIDRSTAVDVQRFAGRADYIGASELRPLIHQFAPFIALGYGCRHVRSGGVPTATFNRKTGAPGDSHVACATVYFINQRTNKLAGFTTTSAAFATASGSRVGSTVIAARHRERTYYLSENPPTLNERTASAWLSLDEAVVTTPGGWKPGETIAALTVESRRYPIGLQFV